MIRITVIVVGILAACESERPERPFAPAAPPSAPSTPPVDARPEPDASPHLDEEAQPAARAKKKRCKKGCPCGNTCISCKKTCRQ